MHEVAQSQALGLCSEQSLLNYSAMLVEKEINFSIL